MDEILNSFIGKWSYLGLFLVLIAAGLGLPLPEDIPLLAAGFLVHKQQANLELMIATGLVGVLIGDSVLFMMGRRYGMRIVEMRWTRRIAKPWLLAKAQRLYDQHGAKVLFAARFMPGLRAVLFLTAGMFRVRYWKFLAIDGFAAVISVPAWVILSAKFSTHVERFLGGARVATIAIVSVLVLALIAWIFWEYFHNLRRKQPPPQKIVDECVRSAPLVPPRLSETKPRESTSTPATAPLPACPPE